MIKWFRKSETHFSKKNVVNDVITLRGERAVRQRRVAFKAVSYHLYCKNNNKTKKQVQYGSPWGFEEIGPKQYLFHSSGLYLNQFQFFYNW